MRFDNKCPYHLGEPETRCEFFEIGLPRTATRSVCHAVNSLGVPAVHGFLGCRQCVDDFGMKARQGSVDFDLFRSCKYSGNVAFPFWRKIAKERSDAKFILTIRPRLSWLDSMERHFVRSITKFTGVPLRSTIFWRYLLLRSRFDVRKHGIRALLDLRYRTHYGEIVRSFRGSNRLLVVNVFVTEPEKLWEQLATFLGVAKGTPSDRFPH